MINLRIQLTVKLIQQVRLIHAIAESGYGVVINEDQVSKFELLRQQFGLDLHAPNSDIPALDITPAISFSHSAPSTSIGEIKRPLIFPHAIARRCRDLWVPRRNIPVSFCGLVTNKRRELIRRWVTVNIPQHIADLPDENRIIHRLRSRIYAFLGLTFTAK